MQSSRFQWLAVFGLSACFAVAETLSGTVVAVGDGDTMKLLDGERHLWTIRLAGIDAPEKGQDFGQRAKHELSWLCLHKPAEADVRTTDRYGRTVARVRCDGLDAATKMLEEGLAWHFTRYARSQPVQESDDDQQAQEVARQARYGLWSMSNPTAPWIWRAQLKKPTR